MTEDFRKSIKTSHEINMDFYSCVAEQYPTIAFFFLLRRSHLEQKKPLFYLLQTGAWSAHRSAVFDT